MNVALDRIFQTYFLLFIFYSVLGWIMEVILVGIKSKKFVDRGFLVGPYCPIYGCGALFITILLQNYSDNIFILFVLGMIICALLEYITGFLLEKIFKARWWDYSTKKFNINGRICLNTMIPFGLLGVVIMKIINPALFTVFNNMNTESLNIITIILLIIYLVDNVISVSILASVRKGSKLLDKDSTEEMSKLVRDKLLDMGWGHKRLSKAFPEAKYKGKKKNK